MSTHFEENNGPSDAEIEDMEIEASIERQEADFSGENGPEAQREEIARRDARAREARERDIHDEEYARLADALGSPALVKACMDEFDYALRLKSGEVIRFSRAEWQGSGWVTLSGTDRVEIGADLPPGLPFPAPRGVDVRLEEILWVMDAPYGS